MEVLWVHLLFLGGMYHKKYSEMDISYGYIQLL